MHVEFNLWQACYNLVSDSIHISSPCRSRQTGAAISEIARESRPLQPARRRAQFGQYWPHSDPLPRPSSAYVKSRNAENPPSGSQPRLAFESRRAVGRNR
jgi:hypothetical protein